MKIIKFGDIGRTLGTRSEGRNVRNLIVSNFHTNDKVQLDFLGVDIISNSFADECIGKIVSQYGLVFIKSKTTFKNTNNNVITVLKKAINDRLKCPA
ncbi:STAS-like domain-containing protein [Pectinatus frisingensis]|uniref:STAS-like domain-containing protein n=1 Tax=Pectinatus frisingensis TaxID=865 RepID=UPI0018C7D131|nr:STAS-like domain-containing protein [Pectinatus frisingensis]